MLLSILSLYRLRQNGYMHWLCAILPDSPSLTAEATKERPSMCYIVTAPLGLHRILVDLWYDWGVSDVVNDRINHCLSHVARDADECALCFGTSKCWLH
ncbi:putative sirohydrochlorin ferrochelatase [Rosa chinensis]|uniref:Putative sirohydrochlorin ferrochelatase n=1 Tax=Rosa chinensis TaxID=74649 RepID=A0A2P6PES2_ROSCH|nr:putative sirohydrochlorin ferrochelatase [Rosa chinensis]